MEYLTNKLVQFKQWFLSIVGGSSSLNCEHVNKKEVYRDYPDAYIEYECLDCGERLFDDM